MSGTGRTIAERALAWALLIFAIAVLWLGLGLPAWRHIERSRAEIGRLITLAERYEAEAARGVAAGEGPSDAALLTPASNDAQAQAALQERVKAILTAGGGVLTGMQPQAMQAEGPWRMFPLSAQFTGDVGALQRVLHGLESARPMIAVEAMQVRTRGQPGVTAGLDVALDLAAFAARATP